MPDNGSITVFGFLHKYEGEKNHFLMRNDGRSRNKTYN